ncbi:hypothetical protein ACH5RR_018091 [Cinchona calisaya]|uniref:Uncharacterized protein n=1 Tax=Cinchona calisaya TaxID=153742 RepID=A0ABD2ZKG6_9GENT
MSRMTNFVKSSLGPVELYKYYSSFCLDLPWNVMDEEFSYSGQWSTRSSQVRWKEEAIVVTEDKSLGLHKTLVRIQARTRIFVFYVSRLNIIPNDLVIVVSFIVFLFYKLGYTFLNNYKYIIT